VIVVRRVRDHAVVRETTFARLPVTLGRAAHCDFVLFDDSCSREHARIREDDAGGLVVEDLGSRNGLTVAGARVGRAAVPPAGGLRFHLGAVELEVARLSTDATQELPVVAHGRRRLRRVGRAAAFLGLGILAMLLWTVLDASFWSPWRKDRQVVASWLVLGGAVMLPIGAFLLLGVLRIAGRRPDLGDTLRGLAFAIAMGPLASLAALVTYYVLPSGPAAFLAAVLGGAAVVAAVVHLAALGRRGPSGHFRLAWAAAATVLVLAGHAAKRLEEARSGTPRTSYEVQVPLAGLTGPASGVDGYLEEVKASLSRASSEEGITVASPAAASPVSAAPTEASSADVSKSRAR
jgi:hypothetical protein